MKTLKLLKDYDEFKVDELVDVQDDDVKQLIADGIAEKYVPMKKTATEDDEDDKLKKADEIAKKIKKELSDKISIPAQPKEEKSPWPSMGHFAKAIMSGLTNEVLRNYYEEQKVSGMSEGISADGGFLIPEEFSLAILTAISTAGVIAPKCQNFPVNNNLSLPFVNRTTEATSWTGGVTIYKPHEGVIKTATAPKLAQCKLKLDKMTAVVYATDELIEDSPIALETFLTTMVSTEMALTKDEDIINGSGAGEALGVMNAPCLVSVGKETGQAATTLVYENIAKMWSRLYNPSRARAAWFINQDCMEQISKLSIAVGTGGNGVFVVNAATAMPQSIFGAPIIWSPHCQTLGTTGDIILGDFSQYVTISKAGMGMKVNTSIHIKFLEDETAFRFVVRFDGQPWWASSVNPKHGTKTVSPFVALAVRE